MPIRSRGRALGVLSVIGEAGRQFDEGEISLLTSIASEVGVAVENAKLYTQAEQLAVVRERERLARELGIAEEKGIRTTGFNLWVETVYDPERGVPTGEVVYHLSHYVRVVLRDLDQVGELLAAVVEAGANSISEVSFTVEDSEALMEQARQQALEDAGARAKQMAEGLGIALGKPILVMETSGGCPVPMELGIGGGGGMAEAAVPSISPGTFSVSVSVQVIYEIR